MLKTRDIIDSLRGVAVWLLVVSVLFGPAGLGASAALAAASKTCGVSCPCDEAGHDDHIDVHGEGADANPCAGEHATEPVHDVGDPCNDECPEDCPDCGCCLGAAMPMILVPAAPGGRPSMSARTGAKVDSPASGVCAAFFRPPRSLT